MCVAPLPSPLPSSRFCHRPLSGTNHRCLRGESAAAVVDRAWMDAAAATAGCDYVGPPCLLDPPLLTRPLLSCPFLSSPLSANQSAHLRSPSRFIIACGLLRPGHGLPVPLPCAMSRASRVAVAPRALPPLRPLDADDDDEQLGDTAATAAAAGRGPARAVTLADDDADVDEELSLRRASRSSPASPSSPSPSSSSSCLSRQVSMMTLLLTCALVLAFVLAVAIGWSHDGELSPTGWRIASSSNSDSTGARNMQHTTNSRPKHTTNPTAARATPSAAAANQQSSSLSYECPVLSPLPPVSDHSPEWPDVLRQSQVRGPPSASASVRYSVNALLNWTCPKTVIRTHAWLDRPDDPTGRRTVCPRQGGNMPRHCEDLDDTSKLVLPYEGYGDAVPYWLRVQGPMVVPAYGALTSMDGQSAWVLQGGCAHQPKDTGPGNGWWPRLEMAPQDVPRANHRIKKAIVLSQLMCDGQTQDTHARAHAGGPRRRPHSGSRPHLLCVPVMLCFALCYVCQASITSSLRR